MKREGDQGETLAGEFLAAKGLRLVQKNYRCRQGEIDLICHEGNTLVFVEVRLRRGAAFGGAAESITMAKRRRLLLAARHYLANLGGALPPCRFDAVLLKGLNPSDVEWVKDAFSE
jgi:putative endonuclease